MFKVVFLVVRKDGTTVEQYRDYSTRTHAPLVLRIPGLQRYVVNYTESTGEGAPAPPFDGMVELWFESGPAFADAMASSEGQAAVADQPRFLEPDRTVMLVVEEMVFTDVAGRPGTPA